MRHRNPSLVPFAATCGFLAGMAVMAGLLALFRAGEPDVRAPVVQMVEPVGAAPGAPAEPDGAPRASSGTAAPATPTGTTGTTPPSSSGDGDDGASAPLPRVPVRPSGDATVIAATPSSDGVPSPDEAIQQLRARQLEVPLRGVGRTALRSSFSEPRGGSRRHEAMDLLAPRHTPIIAVDNGVIARLFESKAGGITVYQFDPSATYVYYYAHLERYAPGLEEGAQVSRGQVIGYVGTSGNAPKDTPHLHFAIFVLTDEKRWWQGTPIDPFEVLK